jgi:hypothetical protein
LKASLTLAPQEDFSQKKPGIKGNTPIRKILWSPDYAAKLIQIYKAEIGNEKDNL